VGVFKIFTDVYSRILVDYRLPFKRSEGTCSGTKHDTPQEWIHKSSIRGSHIEFEQGRVQEFKNVHGSVHLKNILIYTQQDATLHSLLYLKTALHVSGVTTTHHQERKQLLELQSSSNTSTIAAGSSNGVTNTRCCRYSCLRS